MEKSSPKDFYQSAMKHGTYLGIVWAIMYIMLFQMWNSPMLVTIVMALYISSPFIAGKFALRFKRTECGNSMKFPQAWTFLFCMYICATILSAMTNYIFLNFIDHGKFISETYNALMEVSRTIENDEALKQMYESTADMFLKISPSKMTWQLLSNNITSSLILPPIIALFVRSKSQR